MRHPSSNYRLLPVYNVLQDQHRHNCGDPCDSFIKIYDSAYPAFQLVFDEDPGSPLFAVLVNVCNGAPVLGDLINSVTRSEKDIDNDGVNEFMYTFYGGAWLWQPGGVYYFMITFPDDVIMYTETFCHGELGCKNNWMLQYSNSCDEKSLGEYSMNFANKLNLGDIVILREGEVESRVTAKDGYGYERNISTDLRPKYFFEIMGCSWLLDSLSYLKLFDQVLLSRSENSDVFDLKNIEVTPIGDATQCEFPIKISFTKDILVNTKCCDSIFEQAPVPGNCAGMAVHLSEDFSICAGAEVELMASVVGGASPFILIWSTGETGETITVSPSETTTYIVTAIDVFGCVKQDEITVTVIECEGAMEITIDPSDDIVCPGTSVTLDASVTGGSGTYTYLWNTGATTQDITVAPTVTQTYSLTVTDTVSGDMMTETQVIIVNPVPGVVITANQCFLSILQIEACESDTFQWQKETSPGVWAAAPGINNGSNYTGVTGGKYRLKLTCDGCIGYSNAVMVTCSAPCTTNIDSVSFDADENELTVIYSSVMGSLPFQTGYLVLNESATPNLGNCGSSGGWMFVINITLTSENDTIVIPFVPDQLPTCISLGLNINAGECTDSYYGAIS